MELLPLTHFLFELQTFIFKISFMMDIYPGSVVYMVINVTNIINDTVLDFSDLLASTWEDAQTG